MKNLSPQEKRFKDTDSAIKIKLKIDGM